MQNVWKEGGRGGEKGQQIFHSAAVESKSHRWHGKGEGIVVVRGGFQEGEEGIGRAFASSQREGGTREAVSPVK